MPHYIEHKVLRRVVSRMARPANIGNLVKFRAELRLPTKYPVLLFELSRIICGDSFNEDGLQIIPDEGGDFSYLKFPLECLDEQQVGAEERVLGVAALPYEATKYRLVYADAKGGSVEVGRLAKTFGSWAFERLAVEPDDDAICAERTWKGPTFALVGGAAKSGTTWMQRILNSHVDVFSTGENNLFSWPRPRLISPILEAEPQPYFASLAPLVGHPSDERLLFYRGRAETLLRQIHSVTGARVLVDKSPGYACQMEDVFSVWPDVRYIHCCRNPLDVAVSRFFHERLLLSQTPELSWVPVSEQVHITSPSDSALKTKGQMFEQQSVLKYMLEDWLKWNSSMDGLRNSTQGRVKFVYYEELVENTGAVVTDLMSFLGLRLDLEELECLVSANSFSSYTGGRQAGVEDNDNFYRKGVVGDHTNYLTDKQLHYAWSYLRERGYDGAYVNL